ncbi:MAG: DUF1361 domain-containing protein [Candidatus Levyibacteriota bacterium]|nr:MAG: DUF1361 domain-containing protein [Candidatus Levybacteria bacterium]
MSLLFLNLFWIATNILLAVLAVDFGWLAWKIKQTQLKPALWFLWLLFVPNTMYMVTDLIHFQKQFNKVNASATDIAILILQYSILLLATLITFLLAMHPFEKTLIKKLKHPLYVSFAIFVVNFIIAFGIVIGRVQRTNSWEVFTNIGKVIQDSNNVFTSQELMTLVIFFGVLNNCVYFFFRKKVYLYEIAK